MELNIFQLFILFGIFMGGICIAILELSSVVKRKSNVYLTFLIFSFVGNLSLYWLRDVNLLSDEKMQLFFIPWQSLIAPIFLLYVHSLKIFDHFPFRKKLLFIPFGVALIFHIFIKFSILTNSTPIWIRPSWVPTFYLIEEIISLLYCLGATFMVYTWIKKEKKANNYIGYGVNKEIVKWILVMMKMGIVLAFIWVISLYVVNRFSYDLKGYYVLWTLMAIVLNVLGFIGIYYSLKEGEFREVNLIDQEISQVSNSKGANVRLSAPSKYLNEEHVNILFLLTSRLSKASSINMLREELKTWLSEEFQVMNIKFDESDEIADQNSNAAIALKIPYASNVVGSSLIIYPESAIKEAEMYYFNLAAKAYGYHENRLHKKLQKTKIDSSNKVFQSLLSILQKEELYRQPNLDLGMLAARLKVSSGYLSKVINEASNKSFNELINDYRIEKAKLFMMDESYDHYSIVGYGLESGFNSKSTFYKAFQKREGMSPGKYINTVSNNS